MQKSPRSDTVSTSYASVCTDDVGGISRGPYDSLREGDVESVLIKSGSNCNDCVDAVNAECRSKGTLIDTNESTLRRTLPFSEYVSVFANCTNALLGVSIFTTPWGYAKSGLLGGTLITVFVASLSFETARSLLELQRILYLRTGEVKSYPEIASYSIGASSSSVVHTATAISCLGGCVGFLIFLGELCGQLFGLSHVTVTVAVTPFLIVLSFIRSFKELTILTALGVISLAITVVIIMIDGAKHTTMDTVKSTPLFLPLSSTLVFIGPATFCYTIHYCVLAIGAEELENIKNENTPYSPMSGENTPEVTGESEHDKILIDRETIHFDDNIESNNPTNEFQCALMMNGKIEKNKEIEYLTSVTAVKFDIENFANKIQNSSNINEKYEFKTIEEKVEKDVVKMTAVSDITGPLGSAYIMTSLLNIFMGGTGYAFYRASVMIRRPDGTPQIGCGDRVCQNIVLNLSGGKVKHVVGIVLCISILIGYIIILSPVRDNIERELVRLFQFKSEKSVNKTIFENFIRTLLVLSTAAIAILAPYFGEVLGAVGGLTDSLQAFVLPPLICYSMHSKNILRFSCRKQLFYIFVFVWGVCTMSFTVIRLTRLM